MFLLAYTNISDKVLMVKAKMTRESRVGISTPRLQEIIYNFDYVRINLLTHLLFCMPHNNTPLGSCLIRIYDGVDECTPTPVHLVQLYPVSCSMRVPDISIMVGPFRYLSRPPPSRPGSTFRPHATRRRLVGTGSCAFRILGEIRIPDELRCRRI